MLWHPYPIKDKPELHCRVSTQFYFQTDSPQTAERKLTNYPSWPSKCGTILFKLVTGRQKALWAGRTVE